MVVHTHVCGFGRLVDMRSVDWCAVSIGVAAADSVVEDEDAFGAGDFFEDEFLDFGVVGALNFVVVGKVGVLHFARDVLEDAEAAFVHVEFVFAAADVLNRDGLFILAVVALRTLLVL
jgi:hypothetical protein